MAQRLVIAAFWTEDEDVVDKLVDLISDNGLNVSRSGGVGVYNEGEVNDDFRELLFRLNQDEAGTYVPPTNDRQEAA